MLLRSCRLTLSVLVVGLLTAIWWTSPASAAPGDLDPSFGSGGLVAISGFGTPTRGGGMTLQADGKIVTIGETLSEDWAISRFNSDGTPDTSFSGDGLQTLDMGSSDWTDDVAVQPDGKLVVVGTASSSGGSAIARYTADGTLDTSFSGDGIATMDFGASGLALQSDGKIVVVGGTADSNYALARYNADGSLDGTFGDGGTKTTNLGYGHQGATAVAVQSDGKLVVTGLASEVIQPPDDFLEDFLVLRYTANGTLDPSFSGDGVQITRWPGDSDAFDLALQSDGKIVVIGDVYSEAEGNFDFGVVRYLPDGTPDSSFGGDGQTTVSFGDDNDFGQALALQSDGRIMIAGGALAAGIDNAFGLARLNADGSLDAGFGGDGKVTTVFDAGAAHAYGVGIQADGQIVAAGDLISTVPGPDQLAMARYEGGGSPPAPQPPVNTALPQISGSPSVGSTLRASTGSWLGDQPISFGYQWLQDGSPIDGATDSSYVVSSADQGHQLAAMVTATNASGSASGISTAVSIPAAPPSGGGSGSGGEQQPGGGGSSPPSARASVASVGRVGVQGASVIVQLHCSLGGGCPVAATLSVREKLRGNQVVGVGARLHSKTIVIGKTTTTVASGQSKQLVVKLNRTGRALLRRFGKLKATLRVAQGQRVMRRGGVRVG